MLSLVIIMVRPSHLATIEECLFASAGPRLWYNFQDNIIAAPSLPAYRQKLEKALVLAVISGPNVM